MIGLVVVALAEPALAQHTFQRTLTVDPKVGAADFTTIQAAINSLRIGADPTNRITVLIYAGTYNESVTLNGTKENVDLVGVDRDAVIIAPTAAGNGITITSGTEVSRNNTIRNLTIRTSDGHGIEIVKGGTPVPADIVIEDCVIEADGTGKNGITGSDSERVSILACDVESDDSIGATVGDFWTVSDSRIASVETGVALGHGIDSVQKEGLHVVRSLIESIDDVALRLSGSPSIKAEALVEFTTLRSQGVGGPARGTVSLLGVKDSLFFSCVIINDATLRTTGVEPDANGIFADTTGGGGQGANNTVFVSCRILVSGSAATTMAVGIKHDVGGIILFDDCTFVVSNKGDPEDDSVLARSWGVQSNKSTGGGVAFIGGSISTSSTREREPEVFDMGSLQIVEIGPMLMSGTRLSKWRGPISSSERRRSVTQRVIGINNGTSDAILASTTLTGSEQEITPSNQPDGYRVVSATGSAIVMTQTVYIVGTDFAGNEISDAITLTGTLDASGVKPFATISKIILPAQTSSGQMIKIGETNELGLQFPIGDTTDVIQIGRKVSAAKSYSVELLTNFMVDVNYATIEPDSIADGDSFEFIVLSSQ